MGNSISVLGSGWLGLPLVKAMIQNGYAVKASARSESTYQKLNKNFSQAYIIDLDDIDAKSTFFNCDCLIFNVPPSSYPDKYQQQLKIILNTLKANNASIIFTSSISVYGNPSVLVKENSPLNPLTVSAKKIVDTEKLIIESGIDHLILRLGGLVGEERHAVKFLSGRKNVAGALHPVNLLHLEDAIAIVIHLLKSKHWNEIFNCTSPEHPEKKEFYTQIAKKAGFEIPIFEEDISKGKIISTEKLLKTNYRFLHPNPINYPFNK